MPPSNALTFAVTTLDGVAITDEVRLLDETAPMGVSAMICARGPANAASPEGSLDRSSTGGMVGGAWEGMSRSARIAPWRRSQG